MDDKYLSLISFFENYRDKTVSAREISAKMGYSTRSALRYINIINSLDDNESFRIVSVRNKGFKLQILNEKKYEDFINTILINKTLSDEQISLLFRLVFNDLSVENLENTLNYSQPSIGRLISTLNEKLVNRRLSIVRKNNTYTLEGNEIQIRNFGQYLWQLNNYEISILPEFCVNEFIKYRDYLKNNEVTDLPELHSFLFICLIREMNGHSVEFSSVLRGIYNKKHVNEKMLSLILKFFKDNYMTDMSVDEQIFVSLILNNDDGNSNFSDNINAIMPVVNLLLKKIDTKYGTDFENDNELLNAFCSHIASNMTSYILMNKVDNQLLNQIRLNYTNEHVYALELANGLFELLNIVISDEDIGYLTLHFANCLENKKQTEGVDTTIIYSQSLTVGNVLFLRLKSLYPSMNLSIKRIDEAINADSVKIIYENDIEVEDAVKVSLFLNEEDKKSIDSALMEKMGFKPFIEMCDESNFQIIDKVKSKIDFLTSVTNQLVDKGLLTSDEADNIIERENLSSTEIAMGVAFPHGTISNKSFLSIYIFKQPILWHSNYVRMALLMGYNKENTGNQSAIKYLFFNLGDQNKVEKLVASSSFDEFVEILRGKKNVG